MCSISIYQHRQDRSLTKLLEFKEGLYQVIQRMRISETLEIIFRFSSRKFHLLFRLSLYHNSYDRSVIHLTSTIGYIQAKKQSDSQLEEQVGKLLRNFSTLRHKK